VKSLLAEMTSRYSVVRALFRIVLRPEMSMPEFLCRQNFQHPPTFGTRFRNIQTLIIISLIIIIIIIIDSYTWNITHNTESTAV